MKSGFKLIASLFLTLALCVPAMAKDAAPKQSVLITNVNVFDGKSDQAGSKPHADHEGCKIYKNTVK